ncbi:MAG: hypothetical protein QM667_11980 [Asticcacaulis sp.]
MAYLALAVWGYMSGYCAWNLFRAITRKEVRVGFRVNPFGRYRTETYAKDSDEGLAYWIATTAYAFGTVLTAGVFVLFVCRLLQGLPL